MKSPIKLLLTALLACVLLAPAFAVQAIAQGCLAAHTSQPVISALSDMGGSHSGKPNWLRRPLTVEVDWRSFSSFRHFVGTVEQAQRVMLGNQIKNHQNIYEISAFYQFTSRWSVNAWVPVLQGTRSQKYAPNGIYEIAGIGDMILGAQVLVFLPPTENGGKVAVSMGLKLPT